MLEVITVISYWLFLVPPSYKFCKKKHLIESNFDSSDVFKYIQTNCIFALIALVGYIVIFRLVMWYYAKVKAFDNKMWYDLHSPMLDRKESRNNLVCSWSGPDEVDSAELSATKENKKVPHSKTDENILVGIHVEKQTQLESSTTSEKHDVDIP
nr:uncharacterized protein LOC122321790 [Drosophila bipectinata]